MKHKEMDQIIRSYTMAGMKPNVSELARKYGLSRGMVARHIKALDLKNEPKERKRRTCSLMKYDEVVKVFLSDSCCSLKSIYMYLLNVEAAEKELGTYSNFKQYVARHFKEIRKKAKEETAAYRYETPPGDMIQFDWIEDMKTKLKDGKTITYNVWSATLGYSRLHYYDVSIGKAEHDMRRCFINTILRLGGVPKRALTDNMTAIVTIKGNKKYIHPTCIQFFKDMGTKLELCKVRTPRTKGKDEVCNKYQNWLAPYDGKFETAEDLFKAIPDILFSANFQENSTTKIPPAVLFKKEREHLQELPSMDVIRSYYQSFVQKEVNKSCLVQHKGASYGVPMKYCNKKMYLLEVEKSIYLYSEDLKEYVLYPKYSNGIHYATGLYNIAQRKDETEEQFHTRIKDNLNRLAKIGDKSEEGEIAV